MAEEDDVPNKKKKVEGPKKETLADEQFDHVPLIQLTALIPKITKKGLANRVPRKRRVKFPELQNIQSTVKNLLQQVTPREILEVVNDLMVGDDVEVGREVNFNTISSECGGDLLDLKKGDEKDNDDKKDVEEKVKSEEEEVQEMKESKNGDEKFDGDEKVDDIAEEEDSEQPTVVARYTGKKKVAKTGIVFFNQEEVVSEAYQASADQTTVVSVEEQTLEVKKTEDEASLVTYLFFAGQTTDVSVEKQTIEVAQTEVVISYQEEDIGKASQTKESKEEVEQNKEGVFEGKDDDDGNSQNKPNPEQLALMESEVNVTLKKRHALTKEEIN
ncbi:hypothetical protein GIB67_002452 [Kingdonia uniflora]|uniref:Uncharacterized protein n=1 Tax=Kingdonia uniflora TaxID=39325 RepID=A0A7J7NCA3_9MAGN|nr:hypothetical protein GIB67_002452 [Kingdonia uniflora]